MVMRNILRVFFILLTGLIAFSAFADAGPPLPLPEISLTEAVELAKDHFVVKETRNNDGEVFKKDEYILISANYTNYFQEKYEKEWAWRIEFTHPAQNDHSVVYKVSNQNRLSFSMLLNRAGLLFDFLGRTFCGSRKNNSSSY